jgi:hypothetical protein
VPRTVVERAYDDESRICGFSVDVGADRIGLSVSYFDIDRDPPVGNAPPRVRES